MNQEIVASRAKPRARFLVGRAVAFLILASYCTMFAQNPGEATNQTVPFSIPAIHILGFEGTSDNAKGKLSIESNMLQFQKGNATAAQVSISSIQDVSLGEADKQVGGKSMMVGKAAAPFGGGRVISLFSHKKYDTCTLQYLDANGGVHAAIFQLNKGQGETLRNALVSNGAHVIDTNDEPAKQSSEVKK
jgi:hypothetical protein